MGFNLGHTISSLAKLVLRTKREVDKNKEPNEQSKKTEIMRIFVLGLIGCYLPRV